MALQEQAEFKYENCLQQVFNDLSNPQKCHRHFILATLNELNNVYSKHVRYLLPYADKILNLTLDAKYLSFRLLKLLLLFASKQNEEYVIKLLLHFVDVFKLKLNDKSKFGLFQSRVLDCIDILKDRISRIDQLSEESIDCLQRVCDANLDAFINISKWSKGKYARPGNINSLLSLLERDIATDDVLSANIWTALAIPNPSTVMNDDPISIPTPVGVTSKQYVIEKLVDPLAPLVFSRSGEVTTKRVEIGSGCVSDILAPIEYPSKKIQHADSSSVTAVDEEECSSLEIADSVPSAVTNIASASETPPSEPTAPRPSRTNSTTKSVRFRHPISQEKPFLKTEPISDQPLPTSQSDPDQHCIKPVTDETRLPLNIPSANYTSIHQDTAAYQTTLQRQLYRRRRKPVFTPTGEVLTTGGDVSVAALGVALSGLDTEILELRAQLERLCSRDSEIKIVTTM